MSSPLHILLSAALLAPFGVAQGAGMPPSRSLEVTDEGAQQLDSIGRSVDLDLEFVDERGYPFKLRQLFPGEQPVVLMLGYYSCPAMCGQVLDAVLWSLSQVELEPNDDYKILTVSIDPKEDAGIAKQRKAAFLPRLLKTGGDQAWRVLTGTEEASAALAERVGFNYYWSEATKQYAHPPSVIFLTPEGEVSRVIVNTYFEPEDMRLALVEASKGTLGTFWDQVKLNCLTFDPRTNTYSVAAVTLMRVGGAVTVLVLGAMIWIMLRRERQKARSDSSNPLPTGTTDAASSHAG
ncbi:MAG: SCO family protein [Planctomycetota bacterium]|nr:SCO family protein [Planctomycetota bacterium]